MIGMVGRFLEYFNILLPNPHKTHFYQNSYFYTKDIYYNVVLDNVILDGWSVDIFRLYDVPL